MAEHCLMKKITGCARVAVAVCCLTAAAAAAASEHVVWAETLVDNIVPASNEYVSDPTYLSWAGVNGALSYENRSQCASFLTALLKQAYGWTNSYFSQWFGSISPTAAGYHEAIEAGNGFSLVTNVHDVQPGDILAVKYLEPGAAVTGHVMIADDFARVRAGTKPIVSGTLQYELAVIDSSSSGHGSLTDTRMLSSGTWDAGLGRGILRLYVDANDAVVGYSWSIEKVSVYYGPGSLRHLQIGRLAMQ